MKTTWLVAAMSFVACSSLNENKRTAVGGGVIGGAAGGAAGHILDKQAAELKAKDLNATRTANGILVKLKEDLLFDIGSDSLKPAALDELNSLGDVLAKYPQDRI